MRIRSLHFLLVIFVFVSLWGCGGGTQGTGTGPDQPTGRVYDGAVRAANDQHPLANVLATLMETGESGITDENGEFKIESSVRPNDATLVLEADNFKTSVELSNMSSETSHVSVEIEVDTDRDTAEVKHFSARVGMVGLCDQYFENREIIRQANRVPAGTQCTLKVIVLGDGHPVGNIPIALQAKACSPGAIWETQETTKTGVGAFRGIAQITFPFIDSVDTCRYRVVVPFKYGNVPSLEFLIESFTAQEEKRR